MAGVNSVSLTLETNRALRRSVPEFRTPPSPVAIKARMRTDMHQQHLFQYIQTRDSTNDEMIDSEDIIRAVKRFRAIWDLEDEGYHNKNLKDEAWNGVCLEVISDWKVLCEGEKHIRREFCFDIY